MDLFISYSTYDSQIAHRLHDDIIKSGGQVYLYEKESGFVDFMDEIKLQIKNASYFCLIDSPKARASTIVQEECRMALTYTFKERGAFIVLKVASGDESWRITVNESFKKVNTIRYGDLSSDNYGTDTDFRFDTGEKYQTILAEICKKLQLKYLFPVPDVHDFMCELNALKLKGDEVEVFTNDLKKISLRKKKNYPNVRQHIETLIADCDHTGIKVITPSLILGNYLLEKNLYVEAQTLFATLSPIFPEDPRPHIGLMKATFYLGDLAAAYSAALQSETIITKKRGPYTFFLAEVFYNKIKLAVFLGNFMEAISYYKNLPASYQSLKKFQTLKLFIIVKLNRFEEYQDLYIKIKRFYTHNIHNKEEQYILAELEYEIAQYYHRTDPQQSVNIIKHYDLALLYQPENLMYQAERLMILSFFNLDKNQKLLVFEKFANHIPQTKDEHYYLGLIAFLNKEKEKADIHFKISKALGYPKYENLIP